jgi:RNA polymerase sigma factor (sigma-70 family)
VKTKISELEKLEELILNYRNESDKKKKYVAYLNLIEESLKLVKRIVMGMYPIPNTIAKDDLIQVGAVGVLKAIETYDISIKGSFKTYVSKVIKGKVLHYLRDKASIVKTPRETIANMNKVKEAIEELSENNTKMPSVEEVARYVDLPFEKVEEIMNIELIKNMVSLDQKVYSSDGAETLMDRIQSEEDESFEETYANKKMIEYALNKLPEPDKTTIYLYYMAGASRKDIAQKLNVSATQISRILKRALNRLYNIIQNTLTDKEITKED